MTTTTVQSRLTEFLNEITEQQVLAAHDVLYGATAEDMDGPLADVMATITASAYHHVAEGADYPDRAQRMAAIVLRMLAIGWAAREAEYQRVLREEITG